MIPFVSIPVQVHIAKKHKMKSNIFRALTEKSFLYLWIGEVFTQIAVNLFNFFLILVVFKIAHSNTAVSGIVISFTIPAILFGSLAGVFVDRWSKKKVLIITNIARALLLLVLVFSIHNLFLIYFISFVFSVLTQFFIPAETPIIPLVVDNRLLLSANALFGMGIYGSILIAYVLSGPLILLLGDTKTLIVLAFMLVVGGIFISMIRILSTKEKEQLDEKLNIIQDIRYALSMMARTREIYNTLFLLALSQILILLVATIAPGYASQVLGIRVEEFPIIFVTPAALGMVIGAMAVVNFFHMHPKKNIITWGIFFSGIAMLFLPYGSRVTSRDFVHDINVYLPHFLQINILHIMTFLAFILGFANALVFVPANTILQEKTSDEFRGKVYGFMNTIVGIFSLLPIIIVGGLSDLIGVGAVITGIGVLLLLLSLVRVFWK